MKEIDYEFSNYGSSLIKFIGQTPNEKSKAKPKPKPKITSTSTNNDASLESKRVYRQGYSDGQTGYGLPASSSASAYEFYMSRGYNFSSADYNVYVMGYNDGVYGKRKRY